MDLLNVVMKPVNYAIAQGTVKRIEVKKILSFQVIPVRVNSFPSWLDVMEDMDRQYWDTDEAYTMPEEIE